jgi:hypothetical protein
MRSDEYDRIFDVEDKMGILWSASKADGTAAIMRDGDIRWICVNGQALELTEREAIGLAWALNLDLGVAER